MLQAASRQQCTGRWPIAALPLSGYPLTPPRSSLMTPAAAASPALMDDKVMVQQHKQEPRKRISLSHGSSCKNYT